MNKHLFIVSLFGIAACQHQAPPAAVSTDAAAPVAVAAPAGSSGPAVLPSLFTTADTLTAPMRDLLRQVDLSSLLRGAEEHGRSVFDGFFGPDHYRFSVAFTEVRRDSLHPENYIVRGKCRYRQNIRPFTGIISAKQITDLEVQSNLSGLFGDSLVEESPGNSDSDSLAARYEREVKQVRTYSLRARFTASEAKTENSGLFDGEAILNFFVTPDHVTGYAVEPMLNKKLPARGDRFLLRGSRLNLTTGQIKSFVVATNVFSAAPDVYKDFGIGDRGGEINPKYAKLGWNEAWENEEWWADSPKPSLNL